MRRQEDNIKMAIKVSVIMLTGLISVRIGTSEL